MLPTFKLAAPDEAEIDRKPMTTKYVEVYARKENMSSVVLENDGGVDIRFHYKKGNPKGGKYRTMRPGDFRSIATDVKHIYAAAVVVVIPPPDLVITVNYFSNKRMREVEEQLSPEDRLDLLRDKAERLRRR